MPSWPTDGTPAGVASACGEVPFSERRNESFERKAERKRQSCVQTLAGTGSTARDEVSMLCNLDASPGTTTASGEVFESGSELGADWSPSQAQHQTESSARCSKSSNSTWHG